MIPKTRLDYVRLYAEKLRSDPSLFEQQKDLIESQMQSSSEFFRKQFGTGEEFKRNARAYLRKVKVLT